MNSIVNTPRLTIRKIEDGDRDLISRLAEKSPEFGFFSNFRGGDKLDLLYQFFWDEAIRSDQYNCLIFLKDNGEFIGHINMQKIDSALPELDLELPTLHSHPFSPPKILDTLKEKLPDADLSEFTQNSIREYILRLPIFCDD